MNLNISTLKELREIPGITAETATKIIEERTKKAFFSIKEFETRLGLQIDEQLEI